MQKDYDAYYQILRLPEGSGLADVESAWKHWAPLIHPDNYVAGPLRDRAQNELAQLNNARDELRKWWSSNSAPPPTKRIYATAGVSQPPPQPGPEKTWQEKAYDEWKEKQQSTAGQSQEKNWRGYAPPPNRDTTPPKPKVPSKPFGPKPILKEWNHHCYDLMNSSRDDAAVPSMILWALAFIGPGLVAPFLLGSVIQFFFAEFPGWIAFLVVAPFAINFWRNMFADRDIYAIEVNPYIQPFSAPALDAMEKVTRLIDGKVFEGQKWDLATSDLDPDDDILAKDWTVSFKSGEKAMKIKLNVRIRQSDQPYLSMVSYWFDIDAPPGLRIPVAKVVKSTDEALWRGLKA